MKLKKYISIGTLLSLCVFTYGYFNTKTNIHTQAQPESKTAEINNNEILISSVGDVMIHGAQIQAQAQDDGTFNFDNNFRLINKYINNADLAIANLETTINKDKKISSYPSFNSPSEILDSLKNTGFDIISTINNHSLDTGKNGVINTINAIKDRDLEYLGTQSDELEKNYIVKDINNIKIGISSFSYADITSKNSFLNGIPSGSAKQLLNTIDSRSAYNAFETIKKEIDLMKSENCELIVLNIHWGEEYKQTPSMYQKELAQLLINEGVDIIFGSHPHVVQPAEVLTSSDGNHSGAVFYSLGNIISNQRESMMGFKMSEDGIIPMISFEKNSDTVSIKNIEYIPTWVSKKEVEGAQEFEYTIIPLAGDLETLANSENLDINELQASFDRTVSTINNTDFKIYKDK